MESRDRNEFDHGRKISRSVNVKCHPELHIIVAVLRKVNEFFQQKKKED